MRRHLLVVSEKKIKMLKTPLVISQSEVLYRVHTPQPKQNSRLFPGPKKCFQAVRVKYAQEKSHNVLQFSVCSDLFLLFYNLN